MPETKNLIAYFSRTGNTKAIAEMIQAQVGGDLFAITTKEPLPKTFQQQLTAAQADQESHHDPELADQVTDFAQYDHIYLGTPTWDMALPQPVASFLSSYDFNGKTVLPFATNSGFGTGTVFSQIKDLAKGANVLPGLTLKGGNESDGEDFVITGNYQQEVQDQINDWLNQN
ncbi:flavodoxin [Fructilactobacillus carniphilus]|uniref:Flavodoxin n=1 Tax=Fructilactobacillus carniphilus TaxID=2940297 RepID=A0ABY5BWU2_9LACO|nr:flavodoxin [Fructilactobacillus carniphilus]USS90542.1 flavodoxin [Fructilactobacillus carniphilus]